MTREKAIEELKAASDEVVRHWDISTAELYAEAEIRIAAFETATKALKAEPCGDCVSREAVLEAIDDEDDLGFMGVFSNHHDAIKFKETIKALLAVDPEHKKGEWIEFDHGMGCRYLQCPYCGEFMSKSNNHSFCPNCGAELKEDRHEK